MSLSNISLPKPKNWQDFENKTRELFACVLNDPNTQQNGRSGQIQNGVDIYGYRNKYNLVGVQCKKKFENKVTEKELRSEVDKAKNFKPKITEFILITTAPRDQKIQETARLITNDLAQTSHPISISVWGWEDVEEHASKFEKAWKAFDPTWNPFVEKGFENISMDMGKFQHTLDLLVKRTTLSSQTPDSLNPNENNENTPLHGQITALQQFIDDGNVDSSLKQLIKLKNEYWANASRSERYRILVCIASAKLKLGHEDEAGTHLLDAYRECPEHRNALINRSTGYLLKREFKEAEKIARNILENDNCNTQAAGILVKSLIEDKTCDDPLTDVPETLSQSEEVLIAYILFLRSRENLDWVDVAKTSALKHPDSRQLKLLSAEAVLDDFIRNNHDVIVGGIFDSVSYDEFNQAVEILYMEAHDALDKGYALHPSTAHNAALALRISDDLTRAKEIIDASINQYPNDDNLRLQRAIIASEERDAAKVLEVLPTQPSDPEAIGILLWALTTMKKTDDALTIIDNIDENEFPEHVILQLLSVRIRIYVDKGDKSLVINTINQRIAAEPGNLSLIILQIRIFRIVGDSNSANKTLDTALMLINDRTSLFSRLSLSFEARKLGREDQIVNLLKGRIATDRESEGLLILIEASINSGSWVTAREILGSIPKSLSSQGWFQRAEAILAVKTGDPKAEIKITRYLRKCPDDLEMSLARIGIWLKAGRDIDLRHYLQHFDFVNIGGWPEHRIRLATFLCQYKDFIDGLKYGYSILMDNWDNPRAHLAYQGFIFQNEQMPSSETVAEDTVVCLQIDGAERRYRIEEKKYMFFQEERLNSNSDLGKLLIGKQTGDIFKIQDNLKPVEVLWVKSVYLDAFHRSLEQFNERFPRADGLMRFTFDPNSQDPMEDIRTETKARAEADQQILEEYQSNCIPLCFTAALIGKDLLEVWNGLQSVNVALKVCRGISTEREQALQIIHKHERKGCVLDAITLSIVRRYGLEKAVAAICGRIYTSQTVIDLINTRSMEAKQNIRKLLGFLAWREGQLVLDEYNEDFLIRVAEEREKEASWFGSIASIAPAMPKEDLSLEAKRAIDMFGHVACDPAIVANGNDLLLLSEDMGFRVWSAATFNIPTTWLQPILMAACTEGHISVNTYCDVINRLALSGHTYVSLDPTCLMYQARKDNFLVTNELSRLLGLVGGASADLQTNSSVLSAFIDSLWEECSDELKVKKIVSEAFKTFVIGRQEDLQQIIFLVWRKISKKRDVLVGHTLDWLIGHSFGMPYFDELVELKKDIIRN